MRWLVLVMALASCRESCKSPVEAGEASAPDAAGAADATTSAAPIESTIESLLPKELADVAPFGNDDKRAVCGTTITGTCDVLRVKTAGKDAAGRDLAVVTVRTSEPSDAGDAFDIENGVESREHWVIARKDGQIVFRVPIATELAHTDKALDETLEVKTNELTLTPEHVAPSSWHSGASYTFQLSPPMLRAMSDSEYNSNPSMVGMTSTKFDARTSSGDGSFHCEHRDGEFFPVPSLNAAAGFDPSRGLGQCGGDVDGTPEHGYAIKGAPDKANGFFRVALIGEKLYVEVHDDHFTDGDRIELRAGRGVGGMACMLDPPEVTQKVTIDGAGKASRPGPIEAKRIRSEANVRTFELTFTNPTQIGAWSGFAIDVIDDDGASVRKLSTAKLGAELGAPSSFGFVACMNGPGGPVPVPLVRTPADSSTSTGAASPDEAKIARVVAAWNAATNAHDATKLAALYADDVEIYGTKMTRERARALKSAAFAHHDRDDLGPVTVKKNHATFSKQSRANGKSIFVTGYLDVDSSMKIVAEGDTTTDDNLARRRETSCIATIDAILAAMHVTKRAREIDDDGPVWTVAYFTPRPEEVVLDAVHGTVTRDGVAVPITPDQTSKLGAACN